MFEKGHFCVALWEAGIRVASDPERKQDDSRTPKILVLANDSRSLRDCLAPLRIRAPSANHRPARCSYMCLALYITPSGGGAGRVARGARGTERGKMESTFHQFGGLATTNPELNKNGGI